MYTLGINAAFHDSAACLIKDGRLLAAAEEERFTGIKHGKRPIPFSAYELPFHAMHYCLSSAGIHLKDLDHIAYSFDPALFYQPAKADQVRLQIKPEDTDNASSPWDALFYLYLMNAPNQLLDGYPHHLQDRFAGSRGLGNTKWHYVSHHLAHAASAFLVSPFKKAAILTLDGRGERTTTTLAAGADCRMEVLKEIQMPNSLGIVYEEVTGYLGFLHSSDEYKVMALASFGKPIYWKEFSRIITLKNNGGYETAYPELSELFGPARKKNEPFQQRHFDIASSLQAALEDAVLHLVSWLGNKTGEENLCMAGGVALNCVLNSKVRKNGPFKNVWVQPAAGDAGTALGAALLIDSGISGARPQELGHAYLGPEFSDADIEHTLKWTKNSYRRLNDISRETAGLIHRNKIIGWFQGRMEFGPRALGARSVIASPLKAEMKDRLNELKSREDFRPVAPSVLEEEAGNWFKTAGLSPFMLFTYEVLPDKRNLIPAVTHVDGTARIQTVSREQNPLYYDTIREFKKLSAVPLVVNTSFNIEGKPIVCSPRDALNAFWASPIDALVMGPFLIQK